MTLKLSDLLYGLSGKVSKRKPFLVSEKTLRYGEFNDQVSRTRGLFQRHGLNVGDRVVIGSEIDEVLACVYAACLLEGITLAVVDPKCSASEANVFITKVAPQLILLDSVVLERATDLAHTNSVTTISIAQPTVRTSFGLLRKRKSTLHQGKTYPEMLDTEELRLQKLAISDDNIALILFTSGTTSRPKGVMLTRANLAAQLQTFRKQYGYEESDRIANHLPLHHTDGLNHGILLSMALGATLIRPPNANMQNLDRVLDMAYKQSITHFITVPVVIAMILKLPNSYDDSFGFSEFKFVSSTAGFLDETVWRAFEERFDTQIINSYGLTETAIEAFYCGPTPGTRKVGTIGKPVDCLAKIVDEYDQEVPTGQSGVLKLSGSNVMLGYLDDPKATDAVLKEAWLDTGDIAICDELGFYTIVGRTKNVIIKGGLNVYPEDINEILHRHESVDSVATVGIPDVLFGEKVVSCIVSHPPKNITEQEIMDYCREKLSPEKIPNLILLMDQLPLGPSGKVELQKLKSLINSRIQEIDHSSNPNASIGSQVLDIAAIIFQQSVTNLDLSKTQHDTQGWDSFGFLEFVVALESKFDCSFSPREVMSISTLGDAVRVLENKLGRTL
ncbi:AMP-binding protein [Kiloniella antarctica]|uniref:AMP-binding protein n=1 Tax=Kiloniella antarctica TaxID=1550907 RepID=A0ABW5BMQ1_9PROT